MHETIAAPAKINLYLAVTGRRPDGFHTLESLVAPLEFGDRMDISFSASGVDSLTCSDPDLSCGEDNLILRAITAYRKYSPFSKSLSIHLHKHIPSGAGLGGGSSDAAAILSWMNRHSSRPLPEASLIEVAASVGSDCPLFLYPRPMLMKGRGELLYEVSDSIIKELTSKTLVLFKPHFSISTVWAYRQLAQEQAYTPSSLSMDSEDRLNVLPPLFNSFESVAFYKYPVYRVLVSELQTRGLPPFLMSGSGSAGFVLLENQDPNTVIEVIRSVLGRESFALTTRVINPE